MLPWSSLEGPMPVDASAADPAREMPSRSPAGGALGEQAQLPRPGDRFGAVGRAELVENMADVLFDGVEGDDKLLSDPLVLLAVGQQPEHLQLAGGQWLDQARNRRGGVSSGVWCGVLGVE